MSLPAEVISHIFSFLHSEPAALQACLQSHPSLFQLARPYTYSHIRFKTGDSSNKRFKPADLTEVLSKRPYIARYIRSLEIYVGGALDEEIQLHQLEEISTILPNLSALREITLDHSLCSLFKFEALPESFRLAFLDCLHLQSMRDVCIHNVLHFPFKSALNGECKSIRSLTVCGGLWVHPSTSTNDLDLDLDGPFTNQDLPLESLCLQGCTNTFLDGFVPWFVTCRSQVRSLEFKGFCGDNCYGWLPILLSSSLNTLTNLDLHLGLSFSCMSLSWHLAQSYLPFAGDYDFNMPLIGYGATKKIPVTLSTLPHLKQLTIRATLHYTDHDRLGLWSLWGFYSPIPAITQLFSSSDTLSFEVLNLDFDFSIQGQSLVQTKSLPWSLLSDVICTPLVHLLSTISAFERSISSSAVSIRVNLRLRGASRPLTLRGSFYRAIPLNVIHSLLSGSKELMQFMAQGMLVVTPPVPTSLDIDDSDSW